MQVINAAQSSEFFDSLEDEREDSAVTVIHGAWLEHSTSLGRLEHFEPFSPLDMLILYQAAAATFKNGVGCTKGEALSKDGQVTNWEQAKQRLESVEDQDLAALATRFANHVIALSNKAAAEQDLNYFVELFLRSMADRQVIENIVSGEISRHKARLADPDYW